MALVTHPSSLDHIDRFPAECARAGAMSRHPAAGHPPTPLASFADLVGLLTGPWRVDDPEGFVAAMRGAALVGGHPVMDLAEPGGFSPDPWSIRAWAVLRATLGGLADRRGLEVACVSADHGGCRIVEARAHAPAGRAGVECFVVAHFVDAIDGGRGPHAIAPDHSWALIVVGDGHGGVAVTARATLSCPLRPPCCRPPASWSRPAWKRLCERFLAPTPSDQSSNECGVVVPLIRR